MNKKLLIVLDKFLKEEAHNTFFVSLFSKPENIIKLYKDLNPKFGNITKDDIDLDTLSGLFYDIRYNDFGFILNDNGFAKIVVFLEKRGQLMYNAIPFRIFRYTYETVERYLYATNQSFYGPEEPGLPDMEAYVLYSGDKLNIPKKMSLFGDKLKNTILDKTVIIHHAKDESIYGQYVNFVNTLSKNVKLYFNNNKKIFDETMKECKENKYLYQFLSEKKKSLLGMISDIFNQNE